MRCIRVLTPSIRWGGRGDPVTRRGLRGPGTCLHHPEDRETLGWECSHNIRYKQNENQKSQDK